MVAADADRADRRSGGRRRRPAPARSRRRRRGARWRRRRRASARTASRATRLLWMSERTAMRTRQSLAASPDRAGRARGRRVAPRRPRIARRHQGRRAGGRLARYAATVAPRFVATTRRWSGRPRRRAADDSIRAAAERLDRPPRRPRARSSSRSPRFQATSDAARREQRERELDELRQRRDGPGGDGRPALALARVRGEILGADRRDLDRRREAGRGHGRLEEATPSCATGSTSSARSAGSAAASGSPGKPPPVPRSTNARTPRRRSSGTAARLSTTCRRASASRVADRGQVDRLGPGEQQADVAVDRRPRRRCQRRARAPPGPASRAASYSGGSSGRSSTRVGSGSRGRSRHASCRSCRRTVRAPLPASFRRTAGRSSVFRGPVRFAAGSPRAPRRSRYPRDLSADAGR